MYAIGKHLEEELGRKLCRLDPGLSITGLRFSNVMAPDDYAELLEDEATLERWVGMAVH